MHPGADWRKLYASELPSVYAFLYRLGVRGSDLEDLAHDTFAAAVDKWDTYDPTRPVRPWLLGITFRIFSAASRRHAHRKEVLDDSIEPVDPGGGAEAHVERQQERQLINEALEALEPERRAVFVMHELDGMTIPDIASAMGALVPTTYSRLRLGRDEFKSAVKRIQLRRGEG